MNVVMLDPDLKGKFNGLNEDLAIHDEAGQPVGHFVPIEQYRKMYVAWLMSTCPYTEEELEDARRQTGGKSWAEIKARLGAE